MKTVIYIWNPRLSSFTMCDFLCELSEAGYNKYEPNLDFKNLNHPEISHGDTLYIYYQGIGTSGIVAKGEIIKEDKYLGKDPKEIKIRPFVMIDPSSIPLLKLDELEEHEAKDSNKTIILSSSQARVVNEKWEAYLSSHKEEFEEYMRSDEFRCYDKLFINDEVRAYLFYKSEEEYAQVRMARRIGLSVKYVKGDQRVVISSHGNSWRDLFSVFSVSSNKELVDLFVRKFGGCESEKPLCDYLIEKRFGFNFYSYFELD